MRVWPRRGGDGGSASLWVVTAAALLVLVTVVAIVRTQAILARHRAEGAADLAALAAASQIGGSQIGGSQIGGSQIGGSQIGEPQIATPQVGAFPPGDGGICAAAARIATANAARLRSCTPTLADSGRTGTVRVSVTVDVSLPLVGSRTVLATARAARGYAFQP